MVARTALLMAAILAFTGFVAAGRIRLTRLALATVLDRVAEIEFMCALSPSSRCLMARKAIRKMLSANANLNRDRPHCREMGGAA